MWNGRPKPFGGCGLSLSASSLSWSPVENAGREYTMKRAKLTHKAEERKATPASRPRRAGRRRNKTMIKDEALIRLRQMVPASAEARKCAAKGKRKLID